MRDPQHDPSLRATLARTRAMAAPARHGGAVVMSAGAAFLPFAGLPVAGAAQPFLLILAVLAAAVLFGRGAALIAGTVASLLGTILLMPAAGETGADAMRMGLSLVAFTMVAIGLSGVVETGRELLALLDRIDARRLGRRDGSDGR